MKKTRQKLADPRHERSKQKSRHETVTISVQDWDRMKAQNERILEALTKTLGSGGKRKRKSALPDDSSGDENDEKQGDTPKREKQTRYNLYQRTALTML